MIGILPNRLLSLGVFMILNSCDSVDQFSQQRTADVTSISPANQSFFNRIKAQIRLPKAIDTSKWELLAFISFDKGEVAKGLKDKNDWTRWPLAGIPLMRNDEFASNNAKAEELFELDFSNFVDTSELPSPADCTSMTSSSHKMTKKKCRKRVLKADRSNEQIPKQDFQHSGHGIKEVAFL